MTTFHHLRQLGLVAAVSLPVLACAPNPPLIPTSEPTSVETTASYEALRSLPTPPKPVPVAVYSYPDLTGQLKPSDTVTNNSRAVTQGAVWMLVKALKDAGSGKWFKVIQRANLDNLLKERQIIRETRGKVEQQTGNAQSQLPSLLFAGVILEGGIIGYDSNTVTGGLGARYLGIGGDVQYRQDTVSVYLNAVSSQTGEILKSVMTRKTVASYGVRGSVFKFVAFQELLEGETGYTVNEPGQIAVAQAIEHAVRAMIIEGALEGMWQFEDEIAGKEVTQAYLDDVEADLLLGDANTAVAQALLNDEQLKKIADARKARRERLEEQDLRRQERQLAEERQRQDEAKKLAAAKAAAEAEATALAKAQRAPIAKGKDLADIHEPVKKDAGIQTQQHAKATPAPQPKPKTSPSVNAQERAVAASTPRQLGKIGTKREPQKPTETAALERKKPLAEPKRTAFVPKSEPVVETKEADVAALTPKELEKSVNERQAKALLDMAALEEREAAALVKLAEELGLLGTGEPENEVELPAVESISQPGPAVNRDDELDDASVENLIPQLKPAAAASSDMPVSAALLLELTSTKVNADESQAAPR